MSSYQDQKDPRGFHEDYIGGRKHWDMNWCIEHLRATDIVEVDENVHLLCGTFPSSGNSHPLDGLRLVRPYYFSLEHTLSGFIEKGKQTKRIEHYLSSFDSICTRKFETMRRTGITAVRDKNLQCSPNYLGIVDLFGCPAISLQICDYTGVWHSGFYSLLTPAAHNYMIQNDLK
jgi:hypothetical protein